MRTALAAAAAATVLLTACGGGTDTATDPSAPTGTGTSSAPSGTAASTSTTSTSSAPTSTSSTPTSSTSGAAASTGSSPTSTKKKSNPSVVPKPTGYGKATSMAATPGKGCIPTRVDVPSVGITEPIVAMGTNAQGQIYPPAKTTMWYNKSPQPGAAGVSVVAGHVTYDGPDDFYELDRVGMGAPVTIKCSNGRTMQWRVTAKQSVNKTALQTDARVWGGSSSPVVALITCDRQSPMSGGHYLNNYVVWVRPA